MNNDPTPPPTRTFLEELTSDLASLTAPDSARFAMYLVIGGLLGIFIRFIYDRYGRSAAETDSVSRSFLS